jgi:hypothetical protein
MNATDLILLFFLQTTDFVSTSVCLRFPQVREGNPVLFLIHRKGGIALLGIMKYFLASLIVLLVFVFPPLSYLLVFDIVWEAGVTVNNLIVYKRISSS